MTVTAANAAVEPGIGEPRWPVAAALLIFMGLNVGLRLWLPGDSSIRIPWLVPAIEALLLVILLVSDQGAAVRRSAWLRPVAVTLVVVLVLAALWATVLLVTDLIRGVGVTTSPSKLLATGGVVWLGNNISFALLYWLIDTGGPVARMRQGAPGDFACTPALGPEVAAPGLRAG